MHAFQINALIQFEDAKNWITALIQKACILLVHYLIVSLCTVQKTSNLKMYLMQNSGERDYPSMFA
jgi:hypothetical protein